MDPFVLIGLDGATYRVLDPLLERGCMPTLAGLLRRGARGILRSTFPPVTGPAWTSLLTGCHPGAHGIFDFTRPLPDTYQRGMVNSSLVRRPTQGALLSRAGRHVGLLNVPLTYPPERVRGFVVTGMLTPPGREDRVWPASLREPLRRQFGDLEFDVDWRHCGPRRVLRLLERLRETTLETARAAAWLLREQPADFFMTVLTATDRCQHALWHLIDPRHSSPATAADPGDRRAVDDFYRTVDEALGIILEAAPRAALVLVVSDHGFGPLERIFRINQWLAEKGWLTPAARRRRWRRLLRRADVLGARRLLMRALWRRRLQATDSSLGIDWARTQAFAASNSEQGIYLNTVDRFPCGCVRPGDEARRLQEAIIDGLARLTDPEGRPLASCVMRREEAFGPHAGESAPDVVFALRDYADLAQIGLEGERFQAAGWGSGFGTHRRDGILVAVGAGAPAGGTLAERSIVDIAPTVLEALGLPEAAAAMDGRSLKLGTPQRTGAAPLVDAAAAPTREEAVYTEDEEAALRRRLEGLGYL